jgi:hypothetical protein
MLEEQALIAEIVKRATELGLAVKTGPSGKLTGEKECIRARWWLGGRKTNYRMSCALSASDRTVRFREMVVDSSWGVPPPVLRYETTRISGWRLSGQRTERSVGGGGTIDYAEARGAIQAATGAAGWTFVMEGGRPP